MDCWELGCKSLLISCWRSICVACEASKAIHLTWFCHARVGSPPKVLKTKCTSAIIVVCNWNASLIQGSSLGGYFFWIVCKFHLGFRSFFDAAQADTLPLCLKILHLMQNSFEFLIGDFIAIDCLGNNTFDGMESFLDIASETVFFIFFNFCGPVFWRSW